MLLYFASRAQNVDEWITPALAAAKIVLSDRFTDSSLVYQGCGRGLGADTVMALDRIACRGLKPRSHPAGGYRRGDQPGAGARAQRRRPATAKPAWTSSRSNFTAASMRRYHALAAREPERVESIDGRAAMDAIEHAVWEVVDPYV